ncbi:hypothetical protein ACQEUU_33935 [Nonomuraea sp. CA-218870]|uniref:hypothetical protein n=1 Tax=Nonomuraea sp. CA-218870 TaxID=3239998 RepID=UPI003D8B81C6
MSEAALPTKLITALDDATTLRARAHRDGEDRFETGRTMVAVLDRILLGIRLNTLNRRDRPA